jgi:L-aminopeptidase/D-esterase-like protein
MITDVGGVRVGHWSDPVGRTGCTVVLFPEGTVASGEVRGGAPGTREWALLEPGRLVKRIDAVVLCGGSAFGLAACDGVVRWCEERGLGLPTAVGPVPIVVGAVLNDRGVGDPMARPGEIEGYAACLAAVAGRLDTGPVGAGCGATLSKWRGPEHVVPGGIGSATLRVGDLVVTALVAANAWGDIRPIQLTPHDISAGLERLLSLSRAALPSSPAGPASPGAPASLGGSAVAGTSGSPNGPAAEGLLAAPDGSAGAGAPVAPSGVSPTATGSPAAGAAPSGAGLGMNTTIGVIATNARLDKVGCLLVARSGHNGLARALEPVHTSVDGDALVAAATGEVAAAADLVAILAARAVEDAVRAAVG